MTVAPRVFAVNTAERPTFPAAPATRTVWPTSTFVAKRSWLPVVVASGNAAASIKSSPLGTFAKIRGFHDTKFGISVVRHSEHRVADGEAFHSRPNPDRGSRHVDSDEPWELEGIKLRG
jgi:hypothetical protein